MAAHRGEAVSLVALKEPSFPTDLGSWERAAVGGWGGGLRSVCGNMTQEDKNVNTKQIGNYGDFRLLLCFRVLIISTPKAGPS